MNLAEGIRKHGFRRWYERELLHSHAHLTLAFVCAIGVFAAVEAFGQVQRSVDRAIDVMAIVLFGAVGIRSLRRYLVLLTHAESAANQADCPSCQTYARFTVEQARGSRLQVTCRSCQHRWEIDDPLAEDGGSDQ